MKYLEKPLLAAVIVAGALGATYITKDKDYLGGLFLLIWLFA